MQHGMPAGRPQLIRRHKVAADLSITEVQRLLHVLCPGRAARGLARHHANSRMPRGYADTLQLSAAHDFGSCIRLLRISANCAASVI